MADGSAMNSGSKGGIAWADAIVERDRRSSGGIARRSSNWMEGYRGKRCTAEEAVAQIQSGQNVYYSGNAATPFLLVDALAKRADELENVTLHHVLLLGNDPLSQPGMQGKFRHNSLFVGPADRGAVNEGRGDYTPVFLHQIPRLFVEGVVPIDVALLHVSPPDGHGNMSLGVEVLASMAAAKMARKVIVLVNERMPRVLGDCYIHVSEVDHIVETAQELPELPKREITDVELAIGKHISGLIEDGACLQLGIGGIPDAVLKNIEGKQNIGIHTEMVSDGVMEAIEKGIITCRRKNYHNGKVVLTFALGSSALYDYIHDNPFFEGHPVDWVNDPSIVARNDNMVAINSAIEVDLTGQVCSDSIGTRIYSGVGGQVDFIRGAAHSRNGKPIIALPATAKGGEMSRVVPTVKPGGGIVTTRADVRYVVTEFGIADLFGKNLRQRAEALIQVAAPQFRDELIKEAKQRKLMP